ncbi:MAG: S8 family serine peptidase [Candidatus Cloacimonadota bacterium]|nr:S8 family serine peptidase [Candidatus Cloacimonadota bacterium]
MKKIIVVLFISLLFSQIANAEITSPKELIVRFEDEADINGKNTGFVHFDSIMEKYSVVSIEPILQSQNYFIYKVICAKDINFQEIKNLTAQRGEVVYTQPNHLNEMFYLVPNDPRYFEQEWVFSAVKANTTWEYEKGNEQIVIGLIDSGVDYNHPDLADNIWHNSGEMGLDSQGQNKETNLIDDDGNGFVDDWQGWDFTDTDIIDAHGDCRIRDNDPLDDLGHGTHCAGIMGARTNNNLGVAGVSWFGKVMNLRAGFKVQNSGYLEDDDATAAMVYAADNGAQIINISWGDTELSPIIKDVCDYVYSMGVAIISSSGNDSGGQNNYHLFYPAALENVISVGAIDESLERCSFSCYGEGLDLVAPGALILSTALDNEYQEMSGTSMAAPFISGVTALLLSNIPTLTNNEIYSLLKISCDDLGEDGYDNYFGHGVINSNLLLQNANLGVIPEVVISSPVTEQGFNCDFPVVGIAFCPDFFKYTVTFSTKSNPQEEDWFDVVTHNSQPQPYFSQIINDTLAYFNTAGLADSTYYIRLAAYDIHGNIFIDIVQINIDQTPPQFIPNATGYCQRYDFDENAYFVLSAANEPVRFTAKCFSSTLDTVTMISSRFSDYTSLRLPDNLPQDDLSFYVKIENKTDLINVSEIFSNSISIANYTVPTNGYEKYLSHSGGVYLCEARDANHNNKQDLVFMEFPESGNVGSVCFCEDENNSLVTKFVMQDKFQPWSLGDTNGDGRTEIVGNIGDSLVVYEASSSQNYPNTFIFGSRDISALYGCVFYDLNADGCDELLVNTFLDNSRTAYQIYTRVGNQFVYAQRWLLNDTPTFSRNELTAHPQFGYLDGDDKLDILLSDVDGDILIFEVIDNETMNIAIVDTLHIPVGHAYYCGIGDLTGDGMNEFIVGGYNDDIMNPNNQFWLYGAFASSDDNEYYLLDYTQISGVNSSNGMCVANVNADSLQDEVVIAAAPDIYVFGMEDGKFQAKWVGDSYRSYYPVPVDFNNNGIHELAFNQYNEQDELDLVIYKFDEDMPSIPTPQNFHVYPLNDHSVQLTWNLQDNIEGFNIYRTTSFDSTVTHSISATTTSFVDTIVIKDSLYHYQISAFFGGEESYPTLEKNAIPYPAPIVDSVSMIALNSVSLHFDNPLSFSSTNLTNYQIENYGYPLSAILTQSNMRVILTYDSIFEPELAPFTIHLQNIEGILHTPMQDSLLAFDFQTDIHSPYIESCSMDGKSKIELTFSEYVQNESAMVLQNYNLIFPVGYENITVSSIEHNGDKVILFLSDELGTTGNSYFIKVFNIKDLAGNIILPGKNLIKISLPIKNLHAVKVGPNPAKATCEEIYFKNLPTTGNAEVYIYNFAGNLTKKLSNPQLSEDYNTIVWNMKNAANKEVASGVYFYMIKYSDDFKHGKIAIIR